MPLSLNVSSGAIKLTQDFQKHCGSPSNGKACTNALLICTSLIDDDMQGIKIVNEALGFSSAISIKDVFKYVACSRAFTAAIKSPIHTTARLSEFQTQELRTIQNFAKDFVSTAEEAYVLAIATAHELTHTFTQEKDYTSLSLSQSVPQKGIRKREIWLS